MLWNSPYLELSKTFIDLMVWKYRFAKDMSNKLMIFGTKKKKSGVPLFGGKWSCLKRIRGYDTGKDGGESRHSFAK